MEKAIERELLAAVGKLSPREVKLVIEYAKVITRLSPRMQFSASW